MAAIGKVFGSARCQLETQTIYPWDSWYQEYTAEPPVWFHDIFRSDGTPYDAAEVAFIRGLTIRR